MRLRAGFHNIGLLIVYCDLNDLNLLIRNTPMHLSTKVLALAIAVTIVGVVVGVAVRPRASSAGHNTGNDMALLQPQKSLVEARSSSHAYSQSTATGKLNPWEGVEVVVRTKKQNVKYDYYYPSPDQTIDKPKAGVKLTKECTALVDAYRTFMKEKPKQSKLEKDNEKSEFEANPMIGAAFGTDPKTNKKYVVLATSRLHTVKIDSSQMKEKIKQIFKDDDVTVIHLNDGKTNFWTYEILHWLREHIKSEAPLPEVENRECMYRYSHAHSHRCLLFWIVPDTSISDRHAG